MVFFAGSGTIDAAEVSTIQGSGHLGLRRVLHSPDIDFLVSPYSCGFRGLGGDGLPMQPAESLRCHGKTYFMEEDTLMHNNFDAAGYLNSDMIAEGADQRTVMLCMPRQSCSACTPLPAACVRSVCQPRWQSSTTSTTSACSAAMCRCSR